jgi:hypothetical protein
MLNTVVIGWTITSLNCGAGEDTHGRYTRGTLSGDLYYHNYYPSLYCLLYIEINARCMADSFALRSETIKVFIGRVFLLILKWKIQLGAC